MNEMILHYIYDPLCGWCYGAAPLIKEARKHLAVVAHGGGMMAGNRCQYVTPQLREFVRPHDQRIAQMTGQVFGPGYVDGLLADTSVLLDSAPPITAMLAAQTLAGKGLDMIDELQRAHYVEGLRISDRNVLINAAVKLGMDAQRFDEALRQSEGEDVKAHTESTRRLMSDFGASGFPSFVLQSGRNFSLIEVGAYLGNPNAFGDWLTQQSGGLPKEKPAAELTCAPDGCVI